MPSDWAGPSLFYDLFDDAAMFPPQVAPAAVATPAHLALRRGPFADFVGPLLVAVDRVDEYDAVAGDEGPPIVLVGRLTEAWLSARTDVVGLERVWDGSPIDAREVGARLALEPSAPDAVEDLLDVVGEARIEGAPVIAKFRTGGVTAESFPSEDDLAYCVLASYNAGVPFKLTAGLHHAVRHTDPATGLERHGFLNVMLAVARCHDAADQVAVAEALASRDTVAVVDEVRSWSADDGLRVRASFTSFGCCGVEDPIRDLLELGLIAGTAAGVGATEARP
jgi:hypothetical protein